MRLVAQFNYEKGVIFPLNRSQKATYEFWKQSTRKPGKIASTNASRHREGTPITTSSVAFLATCSQVKSEDVTQRPDVSVRSVLRLTTAASNLVCFKQPLRCFTSRSISEYCTEDYDYKLIGCRLAFLLESWMHHIANSL